MKLNFACKKQLNKINKHLFFKNSCYNYSLKNQYKSNTKNIAIIGSGPAGFRLLEILLKNKLFKDIVAIDMFEKNPLPFGLVRNGIAPDHQSMKNAITGYIERIKNPKVNLFCNVEIIGKEDIEKQQQQKKENNVYKVQLPIEKLIDNYSAVVLCLGAEAETTLKLPVIFDSNSSCNSQDNSKCNENSNKLEFGKGFTLKSFKNYFSSREFVSWYNGEFDNTLISRINNIDFSKVKNVVIIGNGNVAIDISRILSKDYDILKDFDIADHVLAKLKNKKIEQINIIGRRGALQSAFAMIEIKELQKLTNMECLEEELSLSQNPESLEELNVGSFGEKKVKAQKLEFCKKLVNPDSKQANKTANEVLQQQEGNDKANDKTSGIECSDHEHKTKITLRYLLDPCKLKVTTCEKPSGDNHNNQRPNECDNKPEVTEVLLKRTKLTGPANNQQAVVIEKSETISLKCDLLISSIGYKTVKKFSGLVGYDSKSNMISHKYGAVMKPDNSDFCNNIYTSGWYKRGPKGILNDTYMCSAETMKSMELQFDKIKNIGTIFSEANKNNENQCILESKGEDNFEINYDLLFGKESNNVIDKSMCLELMEKEKESGKAKGKIIEKILTTQEALKKLNKI